MNEIKNIRIKEALSADVSKDMALNTHSPSNPVSHLSRFYRATAFYPPGADRSINEPFSIFNPTSFFLLIYRPVRHFDG